MNSGKICVSVCAETADEFIENIKRAEQFADIIELRFDCLDLKEFRKKQSSFFSARKPLLLTYRPKEQGGRRELSRYQRIEFWRAAMTNNSSVKRKFWIDCEFDLINRIQKSPDAEIICSFHDFAGVPDNLNEIYENLSQSADIVKIAVQADDIADSIAVWKLLERAKSDYKKVIPIAMGEAGKWTRILGLAFGAPLAYASLGAGEETAAGQISERQMRDVYPVKELNEQTEIYGIVGNPVKHSLSPFMHNRAFRFHDLNAVYIPFAVKNLHDFINRMVKTETREIDLNLKGFSVTIPHKQAIIEYLDEIDETAKRIGAVNTVKIENGKLFGYNTDADGFMEPLQNAYGDLRDAKVAVFGGGGAARAVVFALKRAGANVTIFARDLKKVEKLAAEFNAELKKISKSEEDQKSKTDFNAFDLIVNATPLGTTGKLENETPVFARDIEQVKLVYDLIYNPFETKFIKEAGRANVPTISGLAMLVAQGMKQFEIWTGKPAPMREMSRAALNEIKN